MMMVMIICFGALNFASSPEEWRSRGIKLFHEHNYEMATMCFERAGDTYWERLSKASGHKALADRMCITNPEEAKYILREAAEMFEAIGKVDSAARCFSDLGEYERAGRLYLEKCGESELLKAADCFTLAGCHELAADVYAKGNFISECLAVCSKGKMFDMGLYYIKCWKQHTTNECSSAERRDVIDKIEQTFLETSAFHYFEINDKSSMMKFVKEFNSMDSIRDFLSRLCCLDELLLLEEEKENFMEAANVAKLIGDTLRRVDLLGKAGKFKESAILLLFYVLANSLWSRGNKGWPLKQFKEKGDLLSKAITFARYDTDSFHEIVCTEADIIADKKSDLMTIMNHMISSRRHKSVSGEILSARKILDVHLSLEPAMYYWEDEMVTDVMKHSEDLISKNQVSMESLVHFWNFWKDKIVGVLEYLRCLQTEEVNEFRDYGEFCLNYLGVWREYNNSNPIFFSLCPTADWARGVGKRSNRGELLSINLYPFVSAAQKYWCSEMISVGSLVLDRLKALYNFPIQNCDVFFYKSMALTLIYEVATRLLGAKILKLGQRMSEDLLKYIKFSTEKIVGYIFPDWGKPSSKNMILLRGTDTAKSMLNHFVADSARPRYKPSRGQFFRIVMIILGSDKVNKELCEKLLLKYKYKEGLTTNWRFFLDELIKVRGSDFPEESVSPNNGGKSRQDGPTKASETGVGKMDLVWYFKEAIECTFGYLGKDKHYISPSCFLYLIEYLLIWLSSSNGYFFSTKSTFVEWLVSHEKFSSLSQTSSFRNPTLTFLFQVVVKFLNLKEDTLDWISKSTAAVMENYSVLVTRLEVLTCMICVNFNIKTDLIIDLLKSFRRTEQPFEIWAALFSVAEENSLAKNLNLIAKALKKIDNPLVIVNFGRRPPIEYCPDAIYVDMSSNPSNNEILKVLFPDKVGASVSSVGAVATSESDLPLSNASKEEALSSSKASKDEALSSSKTCQASIAAAEAPAPTPAPAAAPEAAEAPSSSRNPESKGKGNNKRKKNKKSKSKGKKN